MSLEQALLNVRAVLQATTVLLGHNNPLNVLQLASVLRIPPLQRPVLMATTTTKLDFKLSNSAFLVGLASTAPMVSSKAIVTQVSSVCQEAVFRTLQMLMETIKTTATGLVQSGTSVRVGR